ncbi:MAG: hypothetical protein M1378_00125 [Bacteroidetes bacterium]|nr:hypothetical protein [Bacteroidota bacterium]
MNEKEKQALVEQAKELDQALKSLDSNAGANADPATGKEGEPKTVTEGIQTAVENVEDAAEVEVVVGEYLDNITKAFDKEVATNREVMATLLKSQKAVVEAMAELQTKVNGFAAASEQIQKSLDEMSKLPGDSKILGKENLVAKSQDLAGKLPTKQQFFKGIQMGKISALARFSVLSGLK